MGSLFSKQEDKSEVRRRADIVERQRQAVRRQSIRRQTMAQSYLTQQQSTQQQNIFSYNQYYSNRQNDANRAQLLERVREREREIQRERVRQREKIRDRERMQSQRIKKQHQFRLNQYFHRIQEQKQNLRLRREREQKQKLRQYHQNLYEQSLKRQTVSRQAEQERLMMRQSQSSRQIQPGRQIYRQQVEARSTTRIRYRQRQQQSNLQPQIRQKSQVEYQIRQESINTPQRRVENVRSQSNLRSSSVQQSPKNQRNQQSRSRRPNRDYQRGLHFNIQEMQIEEQDVDNREYEELIKELILSHHKGNKNLKQYILDLRIKVHDTFHNVNNYKENLSELLKYQIIQDIAKRLEEKQEEKYQRQIKVKLKKINRQGFKDCYEITGRDQDENEDLSECLMKGERLGLLIKQTPFKIKNFINKPNTHLCFLKQQKLPKEKFKSKIITGIDSQILPEQMYFIDLEAINSHLREYFAVMRVSESPLVNQLLGKQNLEISHRNDPKRKELLKSRIFQEITTQRNQSQVDIISTFSQKSEGLYLIQGPPGTGKTETITNFISLQYQYTKLNPNLKEKVIMVCAQSNAAINHIAQKLVTSGLIGSNRKPNILRLGLSEQYEEGLLSVNLSHKCEVALMPRLGITKRSSAILRYQKSGKYEQLNKLINKNGNQNKIRNLKKEIKVLNKELVQIKQIISQNNKLYQQIQDQLLSQCEIVLCTLNTSGKKKYSQYFNQKTICLIIDQAGQATESSTLVPLQTNVKKALLVGDHKQLQPTVMSKNTQKTKYNRSLFERMTITGIKPYLLDTQYRMVSQLRQFPSKSFYKNQLKDGRKHIVPVSLRNMRSASWFIDISHGQEETSKKSQLNTGEAKAVMLLIDKLMMNDKNISIGVIAPYKGQIKLLQTYVQQRNFPKQLKQKLKISTVDAFQGQEKDVIIMTCVRSNERGDIGFVKDEKRMNVSITRAKYALFVFGNQKTLQKQKQNQNLWRNYITYHEKKNTLVITKNQLEVEKEVRSLLNSKVLYQ